MSSRLDQEDEEILLPHLNLADGLVSMETMIPSILTQTRNIAMVMIIQFKWKSTALLLVEQPKSAATEENQQIDEPQANRFTWKIENISRLNTKRHFSEVFRAGGCNWRMLMFPKGNYRDGFLSMYLDVADSTVMPYDWSIYAQFCFTLVNQNDSKRTINKEALHNFNGKERDCGFSGFMRLDELYDPAAGYVVEDTCIVIIDVDVRRVADNLLYDSKEETGYIGLNNQISPSHQTLNEVCPTPAPRWLSMKERLKAKPSTTDAPVGEAMTSPKRSMKERLKTKSSTGEVAVEKLKAKVVSQKTDDVVAAAACAKVVKLNEETLAVVGAPIDVKGSVGDASLSSTLVQNAEESDSLFRSFYSIYKAMKLLNPEIEVELIELDAMGARGDGEEELRQRSLFKSFQAFIYQERSATAQTLKIRQLDCRIKELETHLENVRRERDEATRHADQFKKEAAEASGKVNVLEVDLGIARSDQQRLTDEKKAVEEESEGLAVKLAAMRDSHQAELNGVRAAVEEHYEREVADWVNEEAFGAHLRCCKLAGFVPGDPRWLACDFPVEGHRPNEYLELEKKVSTRLPGASA